MKEVDTVVDRLRKTARSSLSFIFLLAFTLILSSAANADTDGFTPVTNCTTITTGNYVLVNDVIANSTCFGITESNVTFDCNGTTVWYNQNTTGSNGFYSANETNITIRNCLIRAWNASGAGNAAINFTSVNDSNIVNNTIITNGTANNFGIHFRNTSVNNLVHNNTVFTFSSGVGSVGIYFRAFGKNNDIFNNTVVTNSSTGGIGILLEIFSNNNSIRFNNVTTRSTATGYGIQVVNASTGNNITDNWVVANATAHAIYVQAGSNDTLIAENTVIALGAASYHGIAIDNFVARTTVTSNFILLNSTSTGSAGVAMLTESRNNLVMNNTIISNASGTNYGVLITTGSNNNNITNNSILSNGSGGGSGSGVRLETSAFGNLVNNNNIVAMSIAGTITGVHLITNATSNNITNNTIRVWGTTLNSGFKLDTNSLNNTFANNLLYVNGTTIVAGIQVNSNSGFNIFTDNNVYVAGTTGSQGVVIESGASNNTIVNSRFKTLDLNSFLLNVSSGNGTNFTNLILEGVSSWIRIANSSHNFTNITFMNSNGSVTFPDRIQLNGTYNLSRALNITYNKAYFNTTNISGFNLSSIVRFNLTGSGATDPLMRIDREDDETYITCPANECTYQSFIDNQFIFNVSHWTRYSTQDSPTRAFSTLTNCTTITTGNYVLLTSIFSNETCFGLTQSNITFDCNGTTITYGQRGVGGSAFFSANQTNITIRNCVLQAWNASGSGNAAINFSGVNNSNIKNNTIRTNGTSNNHGILLRDFSSNNSIFNNTILSHGNISPNAGIYLFSSASGNAIIGNSINSNSSNFSAGIRLEQFSNFNFLDRNNITVRSGFNGTNNYGIFLFNGSSGNNITNNTVLANGTGNYSVGIRVELGSNDTFIFANNITSRTNLSMGAMGISVIQSIERTNISHNFIVINGTRYGAAVQFESNVGNSTIEDNIIQASGNVTNNYGIYLLAETRTVMIDNNTILTSTRSSYNHGIVLGQNSYNHTIQFNNISAGLILDIAGGPDNGIQMENNVSGIYVVNNTIRAASVFSTGAIGIHLNNTFNSTFINNTIRTTGNQVQAHGIMLRASDSFNVFSANVIITNGTAETYAIYVDGNSSNNTFLDTTIFPIAASANSGGIRINNTNFTTLNNTLIRGVTQWMNISPGILANFTNVTFMTENGTLSFPQTILFNSSNGTIDFTAQKLNITYNRLRFNATNLTFLNTTALLTLNLTATTGTFGNPYLQFDGGDSGAYINCPEDMCTQQSFTNTNIMTFNVSHFTSFRVADNGSNCQNISTSITLNSSVLSGQMCFVFTANDTTLDCNGNTIFYDAQGTGTSAILAVNASNITVENCVMRDITVAGSSPAINFTRVNRSLVFNNTIFTNGTSNNWGIGLLNFSNNNTITGNTITTQGSTTDNYGIFLRANSTYNNISDNKIITNGSSFNIGIRVESFSSNNTLMRNNITTQGTSSDNYGIYMFNFSKTGTIANNSIKSNGTTVSNTGIVVHLNSSGTNISNNFILTFGTTTFNSGIRVSGTDNVTIDSNYINASGLTTDNYGIHINGTSGNTNITNNVIRTNGTNSNMGIRLDGGSNQSIIRNNTIITSGSGTLNHAINILTSSQINITTNFLTMTGAITTTNRGIQLENLVANMTIENNTIMTHGSGASNYGINLVAVNHGINITNNTIITNGSTTSDGIRITTGLNNTITGNTILALRGTTNVGINLITGTNSTDVTNNVINTQGTGTSNWGVEISAIGQGNIVENNTIMTGGTTNDYGVYLLTTVGFNRIVNNTIFANGSSTGSVGIRLESTAQNNTVLGNFIRTGGTTTSHGIHLITQASRNEIYNNTIVANGTTTNNVGIRLETNAFNNTLSGNIIRTFGTSTNYGIYLLTNASYNNFTSNQIFANGTLILNHGVYIDTNVTNNTFYNTNITVVSGYGVNISNANGTQFNNTIIATTNNTAGTNMSQWIYAGPSSLLNFTNTTFVTARGSITLLNKVTVNGTFNLTGYHLNVTLNKAYLNATNFSMLNMSAVIALNIPGLFTSPAPAVDYEDNGIYIACPADVCTSQGFTSSLLTFNVSHWTAFAARENGDSQCGQLSLSTILTNNVGSAGTCFNITTGNITLDCNGTTITYDVAGTGNDAGIIANGKDNITIKNCFIRDGDAGGAFGIGIHFHNVTDSSIINNTIMTNGTNDNYGILLRNQTNQTRVDNNSIYTLGTGVNNHGVFIQLSSGNNLTNSNITVNGSNSSDGVWSTDNTTNNRIENNMLDTLRSTNNNGVHISNRSTNILIAGNRIETNGTGINDAIDLEETISNITITGNFISTDGTGGSDYGINANRGFGINVTNNTIITNGTQFNTGINFTNVNNSIIANNTILAQGTTSPNRGVSHASAFRNVIRDNRITSTGDGSAILLSVTSQNHSIVNNTLIVGGTGSDNDGIKFFINASHNMIIGNTIFVSGSADNNGILLKNSTNNTFLDNIITTDSANSYAIFMNFSNGSNFTNTILAHSTQWINTTASFNNFTNTTFVTNNGSIRFPGRFQLNGSQEITHSKLNITSNRSQVNVTNLTFLNTSAFITLNLSGLGFTNPNPVVDYLDNDGSTYDPCPVDTCTEISYTNSILIFNVSHWTSYAARESDASAPNVTLNYPNNAFNTSNATVLFNWSVTDNLDPLLNCTLTVNNTITNASITTVNDSNSSASVLVLFAGNGTRFWNVTCIDSDSNTNTSLTRNFTIDQIAPNWSNNISFPASPAIYNDTRIYQFNISWSDSLLDVINVTLEHNFTGALQNVTLLNASEVNYNFTYGPLAAGNYTWRAYAFDTLGNRNITNTFEYVVNKQQAIINLTLNGSEQNFTDGQNINNITNITINASLYAGVGILEIFKNGTLLWNGTGNFFNITNFTQIGLYNITARYNATQNYSAAFKTFFVNVTAAADTVPPNWSNNVSFPSSPVIYSDSANYQFNVTWSDDRQITAVYITHNFTGTNTSTLLTAVGAAYNYSYGPLAAGTFTWNQNATDGTNVNYTQTFQYTVQQAVPNLTLSVSPANSLQYNQTSTVTCTVNNTQLNVSLYRNGINVNNPDTSVLAAGLYNYTCNATGNRNFTNAVNATANLTINQSEGKTNLTLNNSEANQTIEVNSILVLNGTSVNGTGNLDIFVNGTLAASGASPLTLSQNFSSLGVYNVTVRLNASENFTANITSRYVTVVDNRSPAASLINPADNFNTSNNTVTLNWTAIDNFAAQMNCTVRVNNTETNRSISTPNGTNVSVKVLMNSNGTYFWNVTCTDNSSNINTSLTRSFTIDQINPAFSNNLSFPPPPAIYSDIASYQFNVTWTDIVTGIANVSITTNFTGTNVTTALTGVGSLYNYTAGPLAAGNYTWSQNATDFVGNQNRTPTYNYIVQQATPNLTLTVAPSVNLSPQESSTVTCTANNTQQTPQLYRNGTLVSNPDSTTLTAGLYNYTCNVTNSQNFTFAAVSTLVNKSVCGNLNSSYVMSANATANGGCFNFTNDNMTLDCNGSTIVFDVDGNGNIPAINIQRGRNVTVKNCIIIDGNANGDLGVGISVNNSVQAFILNNTIQTNGTANNYGIVFRNTTDSNATQNRIFTQGTSTTNYGIFITSVSGANSGRINITDNIIRTNGTTSNTGIRDDVAQSNILILRNNVVAQGISSNFGVELNGIGTVENNTIFATGNGSSNIGIRLDGDSNSMVVNNNTITTDGTTDNYGIRVASIFSSNITQNRITTNGINGSAGISLEAGSVLRVSSNLIRTNGSGVSNNGIQVIRFSINSFIANVNLSDNNISTNGTFNNTGILIDRSGYNGTHLRNIITTTGTGSYAIYLNNVTAAFNDTIISSPNAWMLVRANVSGNFTNTTFKTENGTIRFTSTITFNDTFNITHRVLNITLNRTQINSTNLSVLNTSAIITLNLTGTGVVNPQAIVDYEDDGTFATCPVEICTNLSYANSIFTFNVSHWTAFAAREFVSSPPNWSNNVSFPSAPVIYSPTGSYQFNVTWSDTNPITAVYITHNFTGTNTSALLTAVGAVYNYTYGPIAAGTFTWSQNATNAGAANYTPTFEYTVLQAVPNLTLTVSPATSLQYNQTSTVTCTVNNTQLNVSLYRNGINVNNPDTSILAAGLYNYTCNSTGNRNFTNAANATANLTINQSAGKTNLTLNNSEQNATIEVNSLLFLNATKLNGTGNLDIFVNGTLVASGTSPLNLTQNFSNLGVYNVTVRLNASQNFTGNITSRYVTVVDNRSPAVTLGSPSDFFNTSNSSVSLNWTAIDNFATTLNCTVRINNTETSVSVSTPNGTATGVKEIVATNGTYFWNITCTDPSGNLNTSVTRRFTVDQINPVFSNNVSFPSSPVIYSETGSYQFNVTWTDIIVGIGNASITANFTGTNVTTALAGVGSTYNYSFGPLAAGNYTWSQNATDTVGNENRTPTYSYVVQQATPSINITATLGGTVQYNQTTTVTCTINNTQLNVSLYRNNTLVLNPDVGVLGAGTYNYSCNSTGNRNYTTPANASINLTVLKNAGKTNLTLNNSEANQTIEVNSLLFLNATKLNGTGIIEIFVNGTLVANGTSPLNLTQNFSSLGVYNITVRLNESQNFTYNITSRYITVVDNRTPNAILINPADNFNTSNNTVTLNWTATDNFATQMNCTVRVNNTETNISVATPNGTNVSVKVLLNSNGTYFWNVTCTDNSSNINTSLTRRFTIDQIVPNWSNNISFPSSPVIYSSTGSYQFNVTWTDIMTGLANVSITTNITGSNVTTALAGVGSTYNFSFGPLAAGNYTWSQNATDIVGNQNRTPTFEYVVQQAVPNLTLTVTATSVQYNQSTTATCTVNNTQLNVSLYRNGINVNNPDTSILAAGLYNYTCNSTGNRNYTNAVNATANLTINQSAGKTNLTLNNSEANQTIEVNSLLFLNATKLNGTGNLDIFVNGTLVASGTSPLNLTQNFSSLGVYNITVRLNASENFTGNITSRYVTVIDNRTPNAILINPADNFNTSNATVTLNWTATDNFASVLNCTVRVNNTETNISVSTPNGTNVSVKVLLASNGTYFWNVTCTDNSSNINTSLTRRFTIDQIMPNWSNNISFPSSPVIYSSTSTHQFNITWSDSLTAIETVLIEHNFTGTLQNVTITRTGPVYNYTYGPIGAGGYIWREYANDTVGNRNTTNTFQYVVQQATPSLNITANASDNVTYGVQTNVTCSVNNTQLNVSLFRNGTLVSNPDLANLSAGTYNYTCNSTGNQNFTSTITTINLTVNRVVSSITLLLNSVNGNTSAQNGSIVNLTAILVNGTGNIDLFVNGTLRQSGNSTLVNLSNFTIEGLYNITARVNQSQNYTAALTTWFLTINSVNNTGPNITLNAPINATQFNNTRNVTFNWSVRDDFDSSLACRLYIDGVLNTTNSTTLNNTNTSVVLTTLQKGNHTWFVNCTDSYNNESGSFVRNFSIADTQAPNWSNNISFPSSPVIYSNTSTHQFNITFSDLFGIDTVKIEHNFTGTLQNVTLTGTNGVYNYSVGSLAARGYIWRVYANDTSGNLNTTNTFEYVVQSALPNLNITVNPADTVTFGTTTNVSCSANNSQVNISLYRNGTLVSNPDVSMLGAGVYNYTCNSSNINFTRTSATLNVTVNQANGSVDLIISGTNGNFTVENGTIVTFTAITLNGTGNIDLFVNGTLYQSSNSTLVNLSNFTREGLYNITAVLNATQNYTRATDTHYLLVTPPANNSAPNITLNAPANNTQFNDTNTVTFNYTATDDINVSFRCTLNINGTANTTNITLNNTPVLVTLSNLSFGRTSWAVNCSDNASSPQYSTSGTRFFFINDTVAPTASTITPTSANEDTLINYTADVSGATSCSLYINGTNNGSMTLANGFANRTVNLTQPGVYLLYANCTDSAGNTNATSVTNITINDTTAPSVTIVSPIATIYTNTSIFINISASDNGQLSRIYYNYNDSLGNVSLNFTYTSVLYYNFTDNTTVTLRAFANDTFNNLASAIVTFSINVSAAPDNTSPTITNVNASEITNISARINWTTDEGSNSTVLYGTNASNLSLFNGSGSLVTAHSIVLLSLTNNTQYFFNVSSCDSAQPTRNCNSSGIYNFTTTQNLDTTPPVIISAALFPQAVITGKNVTLTMNATDNQLDKKLANITLPNGTMLTIQLNASYTTVLQGRHNVTFYANDTAGNSVVDGTTYFIAANAYTFYKNVTNSTLNGIAVNETVYLANASAINLTTVFTGTSAQELPATLLDMLFRSNNDALTVQFNDLNITASNGTPLGLDQLETPVSGDIRTYAINSSYTFSTADVSISYAGTSFTTESNLQVYVCSNWDFQNRTCLGSFSSIGATQNTTGDYFTLTVASFGAFSIREVTPAPGGGGGSGGGGGGGGSCSNVCQAAGFVACSGTSSIMCGDFNGDGCLETRFIPCSAGYGCQAPTGCVVNTCEESWLCDDWKDCTMGIRTRECADLNSCGTEFLIPSMAESCNPGQRGSINGTSLSPLESALIILDLPKFVEVYMMYLRHMRDLLIMGILIALFLALYLQRPITSPEYEARIVRESVEDLLVPTEFLSVAELILYELFKGAPDPKIWDWLNKRFPPLVVRTVRLAVVEASTNLKKDEVPTTQVLRVDQHHHFMGYQLFVKTVREMTRAKMLGRPIRLKIESDPTHSIGKKQFIANDEADKIVQKFVTGNKLPVQTYTIASMEDVKGALAMLRGGPGILIIYIKPLRILGLDAVRRAVEQLKRTAEITRGSVLGMGSDYIVVTNEIPIHNQKK